MINVIGAGGSICESGQSGKCYTHLRARVRDIGMLKVIGVAMLTTKSVCLNSVLRPVAKAGGTRGGVG